MVFRIIFYRFGQQGYSLHGGCRLVQGSVADETQKALQRILRAGERPLRCSRKKADELAPLPKYRPCQLELTVSLVQTCQAQTYICTYHWSIPPRQRRWPALGNLHMEI